MHRQLQQLQKQRKYYKNANNSLVEKKQKLSANEQAFAIIN